MPTLQAVTDPNKSTGSQLYDGICTGYGMPNGSSLTADSACDPSNFSVDADSSCSGVKSGSSSYDPDANCGVTSYNTGTGTTQTDPDQACNTHIPAPGGYYDQDESCTPAGNANADSSLFHKTPYRPPLAV